MTRLSARWTRIAGAVVLTAALTACGSGFNEKKSTESRTLHMLVNITPNLTKALDRKSVV